MDLVVSGAEWSRERKATREEGQALGTVLKSCRTVSVMLMLAYQGARSGSYLHFAPSGGSNAT